jgi:hypothetical protein
MEKIRITETLKWKEKEGIGTKAKGRIIKEKEIILDARERAKESINLIVKSKKSSIKWIKCQEN